MTTESINVHDIPNIFSNSYYKRCIDLAVQSKGHERYGSLIVKDNIVRGEGFTRAIAHPSFGKLERKIRQGMANHAEIEAINDAILKGFEQYIAGSELYVAGYFPKSGQIFFKEFYTCIRCIPHIRNYNIANINVPTPSGWIKKSLDVSEEEARKFIGGAHQKRLNVVIGNFYITQLTPEYGQGV